MKRLGYAFYRADGKWGPMGVICATDFVDLTNQWNAVIRHVSRHRIRFIDVFVYENLPVISKKVALTLQTTVGVSIGCWATDGRLHRNTVVESITPQEWASFAGVSKIRGKERKSAAFEFAKTLTPLVSEDGADAVIMAACVGKKLVIS